MASQHTQVSDRRRDPRQPIKGVVTLRLPGAVIEGAGVDVSAEGVQLLVDGDIEVEVALPGEAAPRRGKLLRVSPMAAGRFGVVVRFPSS